MQSYHHNLVVSISTYWCIILFDQFLGRKVYLALRVRVDEEWRSNANSLKQFGYIERE